MGNLINKASINIILVLIVMKLALFTVMVQFYQLFNYKKIFINEQSMYKNQLDINQKLTITTAFNFDPKQFVNVGFLPDNLSFLCENGLSIYQININKKLHGYWGVRDIRSKNINLIQQHKLYYKMLLENKNINSSKLQLVDLFMRNKVDQVFFLDPNNSLWRYDVELDQLFLQSVNKSNINYIIGNDIFNTNFKTSSIYKFQLPYAIYLHSREKNQADNTSIDLIKVIYANQQDYRDSQILELLTNKQPIARFFLCYNYIILLYEDLNLEPVIYKICYKNHSDNVLLTPKILLDKIDIKFDLNYQKINNNINVKEFNLPNSNNILSFMTGDS